MRPFDADDVQAKYRHLRCINLGRRCSAPFLRFLLIFLFPCILLLSLLSNSFARESSFTIPLLLGWTAISITGLIFEYIRTRLRILRQITFKFIAVLVTVYSLQAGYLLYSIARDKSFDLGELPLHLNANMRLPSNVPIFSLSPVHDLFSQVPQVQDALENLSPESVLALHQESMGSGIISIVIACHNEHEFIERTLESILNSTMPGILREIILVDDMSLPSMETGYNSTLYEPPLIRVIRNSEREGLIRSKIVGGDAAQGSIIVFLDAHVKPDPNWAPPIIKHINMNYRRVVVPSIPVLNGTSWVTKREAVGIKMMFDWDLAFHWIQHAGDEVPCMSGGLLAISKAWWEESGRLDPGMKMWGSENIEQSIRIWLCGGEIVVARDSIIAHVFRPKFPYAVNNTQILHNKLRTIELWFDEYKSYFYNATSYGKYKPSVPLPHIGDGSFVDPSVEANIVYSNISSRLQLREKLQCKPFQWFVDKFEDVFRDRYMLPTATFLLRHPASDLCLSVEQKDVIATKCNIQDISQRWSTGVGGVLLSHLKSKFCLDGAIGKLPEEWQKIFLNFKRNGSLIPSKPLYHPVETYPCSSSNVNQKSWSIDTGKLKFGEFCAAIDSPQKMFMKTKENLKVYLTACSDGLFADSISNNLMSNQNFQVYSEKVFSVAQLKQLR